MQCQFGAELNTDKRARRLRSEHPYDAGGLDEEFGRYGSVKKVTIVYDQRVCRFALRYCPTLLTSFSGPIGRVDLGSSGFPQ